MLPLAPLPIPAWTVYIISGAAATILPPEATHRVVAGRRGGAGWGGEMQLKMVEKKKELAFF